MRVRFLTWLLFVSCTQAISNAGLHRSFGSEQRRLNSSTSIVQTQQPFENYGSIKETMRLNSKDEKKQEELSYVSIKKAHSGRGAGGGSDIDHRHRRSVNSTPSFLSFSSAVFVSLTLILMFFFHVKLL